MKAEVKFSPLLSLFLMHIFKMILLQNEREAENAYSSLHPKRNLHQDISSLMAGSESEKAERIKDQCLSKKKSIKMS